MGVRYVALVWNDTSRNCNRLTIIYTFVLYIDYKRNLMIWKPRVKGLISRNQIKTPGVNDGQSDPISRHHLARFCGDSAPCAGSRVTILTKLPANPKMTSHLIITAYPRAFASRKRKLLDSDLWKYHVNFALNYISNNPIYRNICVWYSNCC